MQISNTKNVIKYVIFGGITCAILKIVPTKQLTLVEIGSLVCVILIGIYSLECLTSSSNVTEKMESIRENMSNNSKMFDLDMDVDLDFDRATNKNRETHDETGTKKDDGLLSDILNKKEEEETVRNQQEEGLDMQEIQDELRKRNVANLLEDENINQEDKEALIKKIKDDSHSHDDEHHIHIHKNSDHKHSVMSKDIEGDPNDEVHIHVHKNKDHNHDHSKKKGKAKSLLDEEASARITTDEKEPINCDVEVAKMRQEMQETISKLRQELLNKDIKVEKSPFAKKYMSILIADLLEKKILDKADVENINAKLISGATTTEETIVALERLRSIGKPKNVSEPKDRQNDMKYSELPSDYYNPLGDKVANQWDNEFTILNTDKWQVPQPRPPVCISNGPCKVCPSTTPGYTNLKEWDDSRVVTNSKVNKKWALDQGDSS